MSIASISRSETAVSDELLHAATVTEQVCREYELDHRIVGGFVTDALVGVNEANIDTENKAIVLDVAPNIPAVRVNGTIRDIDVIAYNADPKRIKQAGRVLGSLITRVPVGLFSILREDIQGHKKLHMPQLYAKQIVDSEGGLSLFYDHIRQPLSWDAVEPWRIELDPDHSVTVLNPAAHMLSYLTRLPSGAKEKDKGPKLSHLVEVARMVSDVDPRDYDEIFGPWLDFGQELANLDKSRIASDLRQRKLGQATHDTWTLFKKNLVKRLQSSESVVNIVQGNGLLGSLAVHSLVRF
ncbi:MAG: hypothetical protein JWL85_799 [Candidatus Saccharibacteria bacterium]|nr:hypothetical protein [Candidatus Saccharibacteria bacterium]